MFASINGFEVLQVSAPIAPGSSGGPLFNERGEVVRIVWSLGDAIEAGAPLYNRGNADAYYPRYDGTVADLVCRLSTVCRGLARALSDAQRHTASLNDASAQAWAMRDAFHGLLDVIARKQSE